MLRVTVGVHAGGHEYISTAHEDQKFGVPLLAAGADAAVLDVLNDLKDVTPAATNARISATHSPENGAEKTEKSERELHYDVKYPYDLSHEEVLRHRQGAGRPRWKPLRTVRPSPCSRSSSPTRTYSNWSEPTRTSAPTSTMRRLSFTRPSA